MFEVWSTTRGQRHIFFSIRTVTNDNDDDIACASVEEGEAENEGEGEGEGEGAINYVINYVNG